MSEWEILAAAVIAGFHLAARILFTCILGRIGRQASVLLVIDHLVLLCQLEELRDETFDAERVYISHIDVRRARSRHRRTGVQTRTCSCSRSNECRSGTARRRARTRRGTATACSWTDLALGNIDWNLPAATQ